MATVTGESHSKCLFSGSHVDLMVFRGQLVSNSLTKMIFFSLLRKAGGVLGKGQLLLSFPHVGTVHGARWMVSSQRIRTHFGIILRPEKRVAACTTHLFRIP
jgi:hypothetical protein